METMGGFRLPSCRERGNIIDTWTWIYISNSETWCFSSFVKIKFRTEKNVLTKKIAIRDKNSVDLWFENVFAVFDDT